MLTCRGKPSSNPSNVVCSDRIHAVFPGFDAIVNRWLQVTMRASLHTMLPWDHVFYFGNAVGEAGNSAADARVTTSDLLLARNNPRNLLNLAGIEVAYDYNRDGLVNTTGVLLARNHQTNFLTALRLLDLSSLQSASAASVATAPAGSASLAPAAMSEVDDSTAEHAGAFAHDVVLAEVSGGDWQNRDPSGVELRSPRLDELAWLHELDQTNTSNRTVEKRTKAAEAVDELLATYGP